jgi:ribonuclease III
MAKRSPRDFSALEAKLGYQFRDVSILEQALTHISALSGSSADEPHFQRLEFLGDRVLGLIISDSLYRRFPTEDEGSLSKRLADLVRKETCASVAQVWEVGPYIRMGHGEKQSGLRKKTALLGDVCEAVIAAVYLDGGIDAARALVERGFGDQLDRAPAKQRDAKSALQEWALGLGLPIPLYREVSRSGPDHAPQFIIAASVEGYAPAEGEGASKKAAEHAAAARFLEREGVLGS